MTKRTAQPDAAAHATPPEPDDKPIVGVLERGAIALNRAAHVSTASEEYKADIRDDAARLLALAELVKAYREAFEAWQHAPPGHGRGQRTAYLAKGADILSFCLRAPTPTPNDDKGGTADG